MNWADYTIVAVIGVSAVISLVRGFMREALSLAGWVLAFWVAITFAPYLAVYLVPYVDLPAGRLALAFLALFLATLLLSALVNYLVGRLVDKTGLSGTDRMLGIVFGVARGALIVAILVLLAGFTTMPQDAWWRESMLLSHFQDLAMWLREFLPVNVASEVRY